MDLLTTLSSHWKMEHELDEMELMLVTLKVKNPKADYSEQTKRIETLRSFQKAFLEIYEENKVLERRYTMAFTKSVYLTDEVNKLRIENIQLKSNIGI